jgi:glyoxylase-like metal-dependent hydrolase (beta-lactamase superfamily II)
MATSDKWEIYAVRYGHHERRASANFIGGDPHDGPMPLDYYVWAIVGEKRNFIVDTGFDAAMGAKRSREFLRSPGEGLAALGINPEHVEDVIVTHMHFDHCGNHSLFPRARYHLQDREMAYCTGRFMCYPATRMPFEADDVAAMIRRLFEGRVRFHDGSDELAPGISVHRVGGHTMGMQIVRVQTNRGWVVLASDASHLYANIDEGRPFPVVHDVGEMLEGYETIRRLASSPRHIIPGHDPMVLKRYPAAGPRLEGAVARLDLEPNV